MRPPALARRLGPRPAGLALLAAAACRSVTDPALPAGAVSFAPPAVYARWWAVTEACSGLQRDVRSVSWFVVPGVESFPSPGREGVANGYYSRPGNQVVLAERVLLQGGVVRHEMLHALLRDVDGHPRAYYLGRCAGVVACAEACVADAGPAPAAPAGAAVVPPSALVLRAELSPAPAGASVDDGWVTLTVSATNAAAGPVRVRLTNSALAYAFGFRALSSRGEWSGAVRAFDPAAAVFAAGETKRQVFDFRVRQGPAREPNSPSGDAVLEPGVYGVLGTFGSGDVEARSAPAVAEFGP